MSFNFKRILWNLVFVYNSHFKIPFFKRVLIGTKWTWLNLDFVKIALLGLCKRYQFVFLENNPKEKIIEFDIDTNSISEICYRDINLFAVTQYQIYAELQIFKNDIDFSDSNHKKTIKKWFQLAAVYIDFARELFQKNDFHKTIIVQGYLYDSAIIRWICVEKGIPFVAVENTLNSSRMIWDDISGITVNKNLSQNYFWRYSSVIKMKNAYRHSKQFIKKIKQSKANEHETPDNQLVFERRGKVIFYIGQVYTDSSILFGINDFHSPVSVIKDLVQYAVEKEHMLIIKLHPKEFNGFDIYGNRYNSLTHRHIVADNDLYSTMNSNSNIYYDYENRYDTYSIIRAADICVTINSQAGLEAMLFNKRVITCGKAFYDFLNSAYPAKNRADLLYLLDTLLSEDVTEVDMAEVYKFFYIFDQKYCINKNESDFIKLL